MAAAWALALVASVLGAELGLDGGIRTEGRSRTIDTEGVGRLTTAEVSLTPRLGAELTGPDASLRAQYMPTLRAPDVLTSTSPDVMHVAEARARLRLQPAWTLTGVAGGARGTTDLVAESRRQQTAPEAIPTTAVLRYASAHVDLALEGSMDPRTRLALTAGGFAGGGDDAASREVMPIERGLTAGASLEWSATRLDALALQGSGVGARLQHGRQAALGSLTAGWLRRLGHTVEGRLRAGALVSGSEAPGEPTHRAVLPTGEVGVTHASERYHTAEDAAARLGAGVDRLSGRVDQTLELTGSTRWAPLTRWSFGGRVAAALVRQGPSQSRRGTAELRVDWAFSTRVTGGVGLYGNWQRAPAPLPSFVEGGGFVSMAVDVARQVR